MVDLLINLVSSYMFPIFLFFGPPALMIYLGCRGNIRWGWIISGILWILATSFIIIYITYGSLLALAGIGYVSFAWNGVELEWFAPFIITSLICGGVMAILLKGKRRLVGIAFTLILPGVYYFSSYTGEFLWMQAQSGLEESLQNRLKQSTFLPPTSIQLLETTPTINIVTQVVPTRALQVTLAKPEAGQEQINSLPPAPPCPSISAGSSAGPQAFTEEFDQAERYVSTSDDVTISNGRVNWNIDRSGGDQFVYCSFPAFSGDVRLTATGQIDQWTNNCAGGVGIGDAPGSGAAIYYSFFGGGCATQGPAIMTGGVLMNFQESSTCVFTGLWPWIEAATPYRVELTLRGPLANLLVEGIGKVDGTVEYAGEYSVLWVGNRSNNDWPTCTGSIDSVTIEPLK